MRQERHSQPAAPTVLQGGHFPSVHTLRYIPPGLHVAGTVGEPASPVCMCAAVSQWRSQNRHEPAGLGGRRRSQSPLCGMARAQERMVWLLPVHQDPGGTLLDEAGRLLTFFQFHKCSSSRSGCASFQGISSFPGGGGGSQGTPVTRAPQPAVTVTLCPPVSSRLAVPCLDVLLLPF